MGPRWEKVSRRCWPEQSTCPGSGCGSQRHRSESSGRVFWVQMKRRGSQVTQGDGDCHPGSCCVFGGTPILEGGAVLIHDSCLGSPSPSASEGRASTGRAIRRDRGGAPAPSHLHTPLVGGAQLEAEPDGPAGPAASGRPKGQPRGPREAGATRANLSWQETKLAGNTRRVFH